MEPEETKGCSWDGCVKRLGFGQTKVKSREGGDGDGGEPRGLEFLESRRDTHGSPGPWAALTSARAGSRTWASWERIGNNGQLLPRGE